MKAIIFWQTSFRSVALCSLTFTITVWTAGCSGICSRPFRLESMVLSSDLLVAWSAPMRDRDLMQTLLWPTPSDRDLSLADSEYRIFLGLNWVDESLLGLWFVDDSSSKQQSCLGLSKGWCHIRLWSIQWWPCPCEGVSRHQHVASPPVYFHATVRTCV